MSLSGRARGAGEPRPSPCPGRTGTRTGVIDVAPAVIAHVSCIQTHRRSRHAVTMARARGGPLKRTASPHESTVPAPGPSCPDVTVLRWHCRCLLVTTSPLLVRSMRSPTSPRWSGSGRPRVQGFASGPRDCCDASLRSGCRRFGGCPKCCGGEDDDDADCALFNG